MIQSGDQRIYYSGDPGYFGGFKQIGDRFGGFDLAFHTWPQPWGLSWPRPKSARC